MDDCRTCLFSSVVSNRNITSLVCIYNNLVFFANNEIAVNGFIVIISIDGCIQITNLDIAIYFSL